MSFLSLSWMYTNTCWNSPKKVPNDYFTFWKILVCRPTTNFYLFNMTVDAVMSTCNMTLMYLQFFLYMKYLGSDLETSFNDKDSARLSAYAKLSKTLPEIITGKPNVPLNFSGTQFKMSAYARIFSNCFFFFNNRS